MFQQRFKSRQWWETASSHWQRLTPHGLQGWLRKTQSGFVEGAGANHRHTLTLAWAISLLGIVIGIKNRRWALVKIYSRDVGVCCKSWGRQDRSFATNTHGEAINLHQCSVVGLNGYYQKLINIKVSISGEMAIIPYIHKQILLRINIEHPSLNVQDFYCLLTTLATCLISIECGVDVVLPAPLKLVLWLWQITHHIC